MKCDNKVLYLKTNKRAKIYHKRYYNNLSKINKYKRKTKIRNFKHKHLFAIQVFNEIVFIAVSTTILTIISYVLSCIIK